MEYNDKKLEAKKRSDFKKILFDLAADNEITDSKSIYDKYHDRFEDLYKPDVDGKEFRHFYSDIFFVLTQIKLKDKSGEINVLGERIGLLRDAWTDIDKHSVLSNNIKKLYDHISLDIARINYSDSGDRNLSETDTIREYQKSVNDLGNKISDIQSNTDKLKQEIKGYQKENITILGIFASIVLAFTGGMTFSSSVLENIDKSSIYRIILVICLLGIVLFNVIWMLVKFLCDINGKVAYRKRYVIIIDTVLMICIVLSIAAYKFQWLERQATESDDGAQVSISLEI